MKNKSVFVNSKVLPRKNATFERHVRHKYVNPHFQLPLESSQNCFVTEGWVPVGGLWREKSHFLQQLGSGSSDSDKIWHGHTTRPQEQTCKRIFLKIQDGCRRSKICDELQRSYADCCAAMLEINVFAITWIRFIGSRKDMDGSINDVIS